MTDAQIAETSVQLNELRDEKTGLTADINDYKASINELNDVVESYESSIQTIVARRQRVCAPACLVGAPEVS